MAARLAQQRDSWPVVIELQPKPPSNLPLPPPIYLSWQGAHSEIAESVGISAAVARYLNVNPGSFVTATSLSNVPPAVTVTVEPASPDDWEVVELNAEKIEAELLFQTGVASAAQPMVVWVHGQPIPLTVTATTPTAKVTRLVDGTEISIAPRPRHHPYGGNISSTDNSSSSCLHQDDGDEKMKTTTTSNDEKDDVRTVLRLLSVNEEDSFEGEDIDELPRGVWLGHVSPATAQRCGLQQFDYCALLSPRGGTTIICLTLSATIAPGHLSLSYIGCASMAADACDAIKVRRMSSIEKAHLIKEHEEQRQKQKESMLQNGGGGGDNSVEAESESTSHWYSPLLKQQQQQQQQQQRIANGDAGNTNGTTKNGGADMFYGKVIIPASYRPAAEKLLQAIVPILAAGPRSVLQHWGCPRPGSVLLCGPAGSGKTSLLESLCSVLETHPQTVVDVHVLSCREIFSEADAEKRITQAVASALAHMPSLIVLEDVDVLCPGAPQGEVHPGEEQAADTGAAIVGWLCEIIDGLATASEKWARKGVSSGAGVAAWPAVAVIGTCRDASGVAAELREIGRFETVVHLEPPSAESRVEMLALGVSHRGLAADRAVLDSIALTTDGFDGADLAVLLDRAMNVAVARQLRGGGGGGGGRGGNRGNRNSSSSLAGRQLQLVKKDFVNAMQGMVPAAFWGSATRMTVQAGVQGWQDVGGLAHVREALKEALELPLKYAALVATAPLRLRTGALLYGPPGCGKTHIVAAAVAASGVRCITVSGPELLNKYIGASEAGVRDVFRRAAAAAPSVLFFDEFDAIAPQRGHDNTGVTDRVVNQLLTELDGVEGLRGVCVVAATSRPDLIDAALLRPGRLDRLLHCGFPDADARYDIAVALSRRLALSENMDLRRVAEATEGFSGADLGAVLSEAQLAAAHEALEAMEKRGNDDEDDAAGGGGVKGEKSEKNDQKRQRQRHAVAAVLAQRHVETALRVARPSVSMIERQRLTGIYQRFESGGGGGGGFSVEESAERNVNAGKKVSWA